MVVLVGGNTVWRSKCKIGFELDHIPTRQTICAGERLRGSVVFRVAKEIPPTRIVLRLTGKEKAQIDSGKKDRHAAFAERLLCETSITLRREHEWDGDAISPGTYEFPFNIPLPSALPSSQDIVSHGGLVCSILYKLKVKLKLKLRGHSDIRGAAQWEFAITAAPTPNVRVPAMIAPEVIRVNSHCGFVERAMIAIAARVADAQVSKGTDLNIFLAVMNHASASIHRVKIELVEKLYCNAQGRTQKRDNTLASLPDVDLPGIIYQTGYQSRHAGRPAPKFAVGPE